MTPVDEGKRMGISTVDPDTEAVRARYENAMGKRATLDDADAALADIPVLLSEISRLEARLREATLDSARLKELKQLVRVALAASDRYGGPTHTAACEGWSDDGCYCGAFSLQKALRKLRQADASLTPPSVSPVSSGEVKE